jgi:hypothetical protein
MFFSEEKNQKTFISGARGKIGAIASIVGSGGRIKVFLLLFLQKKKIL